MHGYYLVRVSSLLFSKYGRSLDATATLEQAISVATMERMVRGSKIRAIDYFPPITEPGGRKNFFCRVLNFEDQ